MISRPGKIYSALISLVLLSAAQVANAIPVSGEISISGGFAPVTTGGLAEATGIDFLEWDGSSYVAGTSGGSFAVSSVSGDFASYITPSPSVLGSISDFSFESPFAPVAPLWEIGGFKFDLLSVIVEEQTSGTLVLSGLGSVYGNGFDSSEGYWTLTASATNASFSWSAATATATTEGGATAVPEAGTLALLSIGLLGLAFYRRR